MTEPPRTDHGGAPDDAILAPGLRAAGRRHAPPADLWQRIEGAARARRHRPPASLRAAAILIGCAGYFGFAYAGSAWLSRPGEGAEPPHLVSTLDAVRRIRSVASARDTAFAVRLVTKLVDAAPEKPR